MSGEIYWAQSGATATGVLNNPTAYNNIMIASAGEIGGNYLVVYQVSMNGGTVNNPTIANNYFGVEGHSNANLVYNIPKAAGTQTYTGNLVMTNGGSCNSNTPPDCNGP